MPRVLLTADRERERAANSDWLTQPRAQENRYSGLLTARRKHSASLDKLHELDDLNDLADPVRARVSAAPL